MAQRDLQVRLHYEFKGHQVLEAARQADVQKLKRSIAGENSNFITFKHPFSGDTALVSVMFDVFGHGQFNCKLVNYLN